MARASESERSPSLSPPRRTGRMCSGGTVVHPQHTTRGHHPPPPARDLSFLPSQPSYSFCVSHVSGAHNTLSQDEAVVEQMRAARRIRGPGGPFLPPLPGPPPFQPIPSKAPSAPLLQPSPVALVLKDPPPPSHAHILSVLPSPQIRTFRPPPPPASPCGPLSPPSPSGQRKRTW